MQPNNSEYQFLLKDPRWINRRNEILKRDNDACRNCYSKQSLHVHHRQYHFIKFLGMFQKPWIYDDRYLITLCNTCHSNGHNQFKIPIKRI